MFINPEVLMFVVGGLSIFFWWFFRKSIRDGKDQRTELINAMNELKQAILKLTESQVITNQNILKLQTEHDMVFRSGNLVAAHHFPTGE
jgi:hypothetical protein